uniref:Uncharacterized protein n=1 Tax=Vitis vinifera TaxID=29760 RepID=A5CA55_VITVI|nr:hypothetical protein VITISV_033160 [Vitis vinifera]
MLSTSFDPHIISYKPPRRFLVPKFTMYNGTSDPFDHLLHYRQLMTLDIGNDVLLCKAFPASLHGLTLSWMFLRHLSTTTYVLHNIKIQENKSLRDFMKQFGQMVLQSCPSSDDQNQSRLIRPRETGNDDALTIKSMDIPRSSARPTLLVKDLSPYNTIMEWVWLHKMKVIPSTYHQMVSYLIESGQVDLLGSQLVAQQCYQVTVKVGQIDLTGDEPESSSAKCK